MKGSKRKTNEQVQIPQINMERQIRQLIKKIHDDIIIKVYRPPLLSEFLIRLVIVNCLVIMLIVSYVLACIA